MSFCCKIMSNNILSVLIQNNQISQVELDSINQYITAYRVDVFDALFAICPYLKTTDILVVLSRHYNLPLLDITAYNLSSIVRNILSDDFSIQHNILVLRIVKNYIYLAISNPIAMQLAEKIKFTTSLIPVFILVAHNELSKIIVEQFKITSKATVTAHYKEEKTLTSNGLVNSIDSDGDVAKFVHNIILDGVKINASDIHFEPYETSYRIRYRVDGVLRDASSPALDLKDKIAARIKVVSKIDIAERRVPQDGRMRLSLNNSQHIDFRVSTLPTIFGEKLVLRVLDRSAASLGIEALGLDNKQQQIIESCINRPYGMILVTGPTGSGKTVTLYTCLNLLNQSNRNISTIEDPVEIPISGINQVSINEKTGLDFAIALRAFLRQDPDVIMVGEIRDSETASMAMKASQTGHLVLSTLHTNDASLALTRLLSMGVPAYNVADAVLVIIAQRLVRKLCPKCKQKANLSNQELLLAGFSDYDISNGMQPFISVGCEYCNYTGYKGRTGIFQVMPIVDNLQSLILRNASANELNEQAMKNGVLTLRQSGILKVRQGITSLAEVEANTNL